MSQVSWPGGRFNFYHEAATCAINEGCGGVDPSCTITTPCAFCKCLTVLIEKALIKAFLAGRASVIGVPNETDPDDEGGGMAITDTVEVQPDGGELLGTQGSLVADVLPVDRAA